MNSELTNFNLIKKEIDSRRYTYGALIALCISRPAIYIATLN